MLFARFVPIKDLKEYQLDSMWKLFESYYADIDRSRFLKDLSGKDQVILIISGKDIVGFSTLKTFDMKIDNRKIKVIYSGDTIVHRNFWGQTTLQKAFFSYLLSTYVRNPVQEVYWFLISKGYKTYCLLSRNFPNYWPRHNAPTPPFEAQLLDELASNMFGSAWKPELGVLKFDSPLGSLKGNVAPITDEARQFPDIRFFEQVNPGHAIGDELCCLGKIDARLMHAYPKKLLTRHLGKLMARTNHLMPVLGSSKRARPTN